jgi:hypothetical protein
VDVHLFASGVGGGGGLCLRDPLLPLLEVALKRGEARACVRQLSRLQCTRQRSFVVKAHISRRQVAVPLKAEAVSRLVVSPDAESACFQ